MDAVLLDGATLGPEDLDFGPLRATVGSLRCYQHTQPYDVVERLGDAHIALVNKVVLDATHLAQLPQLKHIIVLATGTNNIDVKAAKKLGLAYKTAERMG